MAVTFDETFVREVIAPVFDAEFYQRRYREVIGNADDALSHYITWGWREGRWPNAAFDSAWYLAANPDVAADGFNPLMHFMIWGASEGRSFRRRAEDAVCRTIAAARPLREQASHYGPLTGTPRVPRDELGRRVREQTSVGGTVISLSHDQYWRIGGGVQNCVADEQRVFVANGWTYLHLCPMRPLPMLADPTPADRFEVAITLNGEPLGSATMADVIAMAAAEAELRGELHCIAHQLLGFAPELIEQLAAACRTKAPFVWVHDLFTLCPSVVMLRNEAIFCGGPPLNSPACQICNSGRERSSHVARITRFFAATRPVVLAPSATILDFWRAHSNMRHGRGIVLPPCRVEFGPRAATATTAGKLRVAFLGAPAYRKGWETFVALVKRHANDPRYEFFQLGWSDPAVANVAHIHVEVTPADRHAMVKAIAAAGIDVTVNWSLCYESFSFTTIEAMAAGAFVVAPRGSGNIWPLVTSIGGRRGHAVDSEYELQALFASERLFELVANSDRRHGRLIIDSGTARILVGEGSGRT